MPKKQIIIIIILLIIVFVLGFMAGQQSGYKLGKTAGEKEYQENLEKVAGQGEVFVISGEITDIKDKIISVKVALLQNPSNPPVYSQKQVLFDDSTRFFKREMRSSQEVDYDMKTKNEFNPFRDTVINSSGLKVGSSITATSKENIQGKEQFTASEIIVQ